MNQRNLSRQLSLREYRKVLGRVHVAWQVIPLVAKLSWINTINLENGPLDLYKTQLREADMWGQGWSENCSYRKKCRRTFGCAYKRGYHRKIHIQQTRHKRGMHQLGRDWHSHSVVYLCNCLQMWITYIWADIVGFHLVLGEKNKLQGRECCMVAISGLEGRE